MESLNFTINDESEPENNDDLNIKFDPIFSLKKL
jgi:hypothetical protein